MTESVTMLFDYALGDLVGVAGEDPRIWFVVGRHYHHDSVKKGVYYTLWRSDELRLKQAMQEDLLAEARLPGVAAMTMPLRRLQELGLPLRVLRSLTYIAELTMVWEAAILCDACLLKIKGLGKLSLAALHEVLPAAGFHDRPPHCGARPYPSRCWQRIHYLRQSMVARIGGTA